MVEEQGEWAHEIVKRADMCACGPIPIVRRRRKGGAPLPQMLEKEWRE